MTVEHALQHHQAGELEEAEREYRDILSREPNNADALYLLGVLYDQASRPDLAVDLLARAVAIQPRAEPAHWALANARYRLGRYADAAESYRRVIALNPSHAEAHHNLGVVCRDLGNLSDAIGCFRRAVAARPEFIDARLNLAAALAQSGDFAAAAGEFGRVAAARPDDADVHYQLALALESAGRLDEAIPAFHRAALLRPDWPEAHTDLANALLRAKQIDAALVEYRRVIQLRPSDASAHSNLGNALLEHGDARASADACRRALGLDPASPLARVNLANALREMDRFDDAIALYRQVLSENPDQPDVRGNLGTTLEAAGRYDEAQAEYERVVADHPDLPGGHWNVASLLLLRGEWERGWREYEWRWRWSKFGAPRPLPTQPQWTGDDLKGKRILIHAEQGFGDTIQFAPYVPLVAQRGGRVILEVPIELRSLLRSLDGLDELIVQGEPRPMFDLHCPLMSLPLALGTTVQTVPQRVPYVRPDLVLAEHWRHRLRDDPKRKVGVVWAGRPQHRNDRSRSIPPEALVPLREAEVTFYNLQKGDARARGRDLLSHLNAVDLTDELRDFADTAALIDALDLVITVDTAVAHLAGAMNKPTWLLLPFKPEWRWLLDRADTPWYPGMKLFRQPAVGDWGPVIREVVAELAGSIVAG